MDWGYVSESSTQVNAINTEEEKQWGLGPRSTGDGEGWVDLKRLMICFGGKMAIGLADGLWRESKGGMLKSDAWVLP